MPSGVSVCLCVSVSVAVSVSVSVSVCVFVCVGVCRCGIWVGGGSVVFFCVCVVSVVGELNARAKKNCRRIWA